MAIGELVAHLGTVSERSPRLDGTEFCASPSATPGWERNSSRVLG